jgi:hypothetical protein
MKNYTQIEGWFDYKNTYNFLLSQITDGGVFVECGAWFGKSSSYLCDIAKSRVNIFIVDTWEGSLNKKDPTAVMASNNRRIYDMFLANMGDRKFKPIKKLSEDASKEFEDNSCDVVFIDMTHTYDYVKQDIQLWLPKVKNGGYIAGHDYQKDWPGVIKAVDEILGKDNIKTMDTCWIYHKQ